MTRDRLSEEAIKQLSPPAIGRSRYLFCGSRNPGREGAAGLWGSCDGRWRSCFHPQLSSSRSRIRYTIGAWPDWSALKAVREARHLRQRVDRGDNPLDDRASSSGAVTVASVLDDFVVRHVRNKNQPLRAPTNTKARSIGL